MKKLTSILIPLYNAERWIAQALESALNQTWSNKEIIVVDDGSTDNSLAVVRSYECHNVKVIMQENRGASVARNKAFREAQGDYIQYLDADDLMSPGKIEEQVILLEQNAPGMLAMSGASFFFDGQDPENGISAELAGGWPLVDSDDPLNWLISLLGLDGRAGLVPLGAWLTPRAVADAAGYWDEHPSPDDDGEYFSRVVLASSGIRRSNPGKYFYRKYRGGGSLSSARSQRLQEGALRSLDLRANHIFARTDDPRAKRAFARLYMERAVVAFPDYPTVTEKALQRVKKMGGTDCIPIIGGQSLETIKHLFGWKFAKRASSWYRRHAGKFIANVIEQNRAKI